VKFSDALEVRSAVLDFDAKRIHMGCMFSCPRIEGAVATVEMMLMHVHQGDKPASARLAESTQALLTALKASGSGHEPFAPGSRKIEIKRR
jgi:acyl-CoA thioesterase FadM